MEELNITLAIIIVTCLISWQALQKPQIMQKLLHRPFEEFKKKEFYRMISSGFIHADFMHLAFNMYVLYGFGGYVEHFFEEWYGQYIGRMIFVIYYILNIIAADLPSYFKHKNNPSYASLGASGAVSGVLFIFIVTMPWAPLNIMFIPIGIPAIVIGIAYLIYSSYAAKNVKGRINHMAHFWGAIFGVAFVWITKPSQILHFFDQIMSVF